jgi:hypothetical protein
VPSDFVHRELLLPTPTKEPPDIPPLVWASPTSFWLEIHREVSGRVRYSLGSNSASDLEAMLACLESTRPRLTGGAPIECSAATLVPEGVFARAVPVQKHHHLPIQIQPKVDSASFLLRTLGSRTLRDHDVLLQLLFRRLRGWESTFFSPLYDNVAQRQHHPLRFAMHARRAEAAYHVELRAHITGPEPEEGLTALDTWLGQWTTTGGVPWRRWKVIRSKAEWGFHAALANHDLRRYSSRKARRNVSGTELAHLLSIPWATHHPECTYAGAPRGQPGPELVLRPSASPDSRAAERLVVGVSGSRRVALPREWNHLAILGRTQSGKSTLALNLVLQTLRKRPNSTVVVIEPTGTLVDGIVSRLPREIASETIEVDPAHATFQQGDATMVSVPLSLLRPPEGADGDASSRDRWSEALAGDLLAAIRSAWGEESIGGRAELVLRALVQGLALTSGSNLVDAYQILSSKQALQRFVKSARPGPLRDFLEHHLPRLDYNFTMSSLDKVGKIATNSLLRIALCQRDHAVSFDRLLGHRLLLLNLSKAALGADGANFLGAIYLTQLWAAIQRSGRPDRPVYLVLDEVHNYAVPALADMLSEGAKFGLHVVAITQYLHRVPPRVRAALFGNVDAWLLFSLGTEDMDDAWKIVNGESHGWLPQDLGDGLRPYEVAMAVSGDLLKLGTRPSPPPDPQANDLKDGVTASSRRYAHPEDSEASPWLVGQETVEGLLKALSTQPRTREELANDTCLPGDRLDGAIAWVVAAADIERDPSDQRYRLTARGNVHLKVLQARRNEGEEHVETVTDFAMFLAARGIAMDVPEQVAGILLPDGQFRWGGFTYNVEVECSTLTKATGQLIRNVKKARQAGLRVLIVLPERSSVPRTLALLEEAFPGMRLWPDRVGLVWKDGDAGFHAHRVPETEVWPFLELGTGFGPAPEDEGEQPPSLSEIDSPIAATDPLIEQVKRVVRGLISNGIREATVSEILRRLPPSENGPYSERRIGTVLGALGVKSRRIWVGESRPHLYDLSSFDETAGLSSSAGGPDRPSGPTRDAGPDRPIDRSGKEAGATDESTDTRTDDRSGPTD